MSNIFNKKGALIDAINQIRESVSKEYADEHKQKAMAARNSGKMSDYHKHMATHHDHLATHHTDKGDTRAADLHMNKATEHENKAKEVSEAKCMTKEAKLDKVQPAELKKDHSERKDKDIDNDGDVDSSDEYLHKRRQAISKAMKSEGFSEAEITNLLDTLDEATPSSQQVKQGIGIARDKRYAGGNMSGAVKAMDKLNKGLARHPAVEKELQKQNEEVEDIKEYEMSRRADGKYVDDEGNVMSSPTSRWAAKKVTSDRYRPNPSSSSYKSKYRKEEVDIEEEQIDELTAAEKKLVNTMYDKKGNLTDSGKKVRAHSQNKFPHNVSASQGERMSAKGTMYREEVEIDEEEQINELSKSTLASYTRKAAGSIASKARSAGVELGAGASKRKDKYERDENKVVKRLVGISKATQRLAKEEFDIEIQEAEQFAGWIAHHNGKKLEIRKHEAKDLHGAKQKAIAHFKPKKSQQHMVSVQPAYEEVQVEDESLDESKKELLKKGADLLKKRAEANKKAMDTGFMSMPDYARKKFDEEVELDEVSDKLLDRYRQKAFTDQPSTDDGSGKYSKRQRGRALAFDKQVGRAKVRSTNEEESLEERNKENALRRKMMDASRGARYKVSGNPVPDKEPEHKTAQDHNKAIGRALRKEDLELDSIVEQSDKEEKHEMAQTQAHFIKYAAEEILEYIEMGGEIEEWYQNKLSKVHSDVESLHSYMEGEKRRTGMSEEADLEEAKELSPKQNLLLRAMATDPQDINKMRRAIKLGDKALMNPVMRQEILKMLDQMMDVSLNDPTIFAKTRQIFKKRKATDTTNTE